MTPPDGVEVRRCECCAGWVAANDKWECERGTAEEAVAALVAAEVLGRASLDPQ